MFVLVNKSRGVYEAQPRTNNKVVASWKSSNFFKLRFHSLGRLGVPRVDLHEFGSDFSATHKRPSLGYLTVGSLDL